MITEETEPVDMPIKYAVRNYALLSEKPITSKEYKESKKKSVISLLETLPLIEVALRLSVTFSLGCSGCYTGCTSETTKPLVLWSHVVPPDRS